MIPLRQTQLRTDLIKPNKNISFPIGTILAVKTYFHKLRLDDIIGKHKKKGIDLNGLVQAVLSYRLSENQSISQGYNWIVQPELLNEFNLETFKERTLYRAFEKIGENYEEILADIIDVVFETNDFEHTNINMDWTSIVLYGTKCTLGKYGYSRDHRPDKKQITVGLTELADPINVPIGMTVKEGNVPDQVHFDDTFDQVVGRLKKGSLIVMDQGANRKKNLDLIENSELKYLTARQLNTSDQDTWIKDFDKSKAELIDEETGVYGLIKQFPSRINYLYFSETLHQTKIESKLRKVERLFEEAKTIQKSIDKNKKLPKKYRINNPLVDCEYSYQTKLTSMSENEAKMILEKASITGREGFFVLVSNKDLTLEEALTIYRKKDSIEKIFNSLKNEIDITPLRVWSDDSMNGALLIGFIAQLIISLIRFEHKELKHTSPKFIKISLMNLTVTVEFQKKVQKRRIYSNFNPISNVILAQNKGFI
jgi:transposase